MAKVQYMCNLRPRNEWSGNIFYTFEKNEDGETTLTVKDLALMQSYGSEAFTHFSNTDVYATDYIAQHRKLFGCYMGLLHSHHNMTLGPSGTDDNTMNQEANAPDNNNFLSIIVYNDRNITPYSVRISQHVRHEVLPGDMFSNEFGTEFNEGKSPKVWKSKTETEILVVDKDYITYSEPSWTDEEKAEFEKRVKVLDEKHAEEQRPKVVPAAVDVSYPYRHDADDEWNTEDYYGYGGYYGGYYSAKNTTSTNITMTTKITPFKRKYTSTMDGLFPSQIARMLIRLSYSTGPSYYNANEMATSLENIEDEFYTIVNNMNDYKKVLKTALPPLVAFIASFYKEGITSHTFKNDFTIAFTRIRDGLWNQSAEVKAICTELIKSTKAIIDAAVKAKKIKSKKK